MFISDTAGINTQTCMGNKMLIQTLKEDGLEARRDSLSLITCFIIFEPICRGGALYQLIQEQIGRSHGRYGQLKAIAYEVHHGQVTSK